MPNYRRWFATALVLLLAATCARAALDPAKDAELTIVSAVIGTDPHLRDVTARVAGLLRSRGDSLTVDRATLEGDTPSGYIIRELNITYRLNGTTRLLTVRAGQKVSYEMLLNNAAGGGAATARTKTGAQLLTEAQMAAVVLIEGDKDVATGFITNVHDTECVVTNLHVLVENQIITVKNLQGKILAVQSMIGAVGADIALLRLSSPTGEAPDLVVADDVFKSAQIGDRVVVVVSNHPGGGLATQTSGQLKGIGPGRVEIDAKFQSGSDGSPIFDAATRQVIGVATATETLTLDAVGRPATATDSAVNHETRWFGSRLDTVKQWEAIDGTRWRGQARQLQDFADTSQALLAVYHGQFTAAGNKSSRLRTILAQFASSSGWSHPATMEPGTLRDLFRKVRAFAEEGEKPFSEAEYYDYFHSSLNWDTSVPLQLKYRDELINAFKDIDANVPNYQAHLK